MAPEPWYISESQADDYQIQIIRKKIGSSFVVKGCAGSGKTLLALWTAAELQKSGQDDYVIVVYTKALKAFIMGGIKELNLDESKIMYHYEWKKKGYPSADYIIVDEVQDFNESEIKKFENAAQKHLILFGDSAQQIYSDYREGLLTMEQISTLIDLRLEPLVFNHRLPKKIAGVADQITNFNEQLEDRCKNDGVNKPRLIECNSLHLQLDYIRSVIVSQGYEDVGILFPSNDQVESAYNYYTDKDFKVEFKAGYGRNSMTLDFSTSLPKMMTYHSAKGLQFEAVFLPGFKLSGNVNPAYVAITRSYRDLFILYSQPTDPFNHKVDKSLFEIHDETNFNDSSNNSELSSDLSLNEDELDEDLPF